MRTLPPMHRVTIEAHTVGRWPIEARTFELPAVDAYDAILRALRWAHANAGAPCWRALLRQSYPFATAKRADGSTASVVELSGQLEIPLELAA